MVCKVISTPWGILNVRALGCFLMMCTGLGLICFYQTIILFYIFLSSSNNTSTNVNHPWMTALCRCYCIAEFHDSFVSLVDLVCFRILQNDIIFSNFIYVPTMAPLRAQGRINCFFLLIYISSRFNFTIEVKFTTFLHF